MFSTHLPEIDKKLYVGSYEAIQSEDWTSCLCTAFCPASTHNHVEQHVFYDTTNPDHQSDADAAFMIFTGAEKLAAMLKPDGQPRGDERVLVNCHMGMNRSGSIIVAYAVGYLGWSPSTAIAYLRSRNLETRQRSAIMNTTFHSIVSSIKPREFLTYPRCFIPDFLMEQERRQVG